MRDQTDIKFTFVQVVELAVEQLEVSGGLVDFSTFAGLHHICGASSEQKRLTKPTLEA